MGPGIFAASRVKTECGFGTLASKPVGKMRRGGRQFLFPLDHFLGEPLKPLPNRFALDETPIFFDEDTHFPPRDRNAAAEEVGHEIERNFAAIHEHADAFPSETDQEHRILPVGAEQLANLFAVGSIGKRVDSPERTGERRVLKRTHQLKHCIPALALAVMMDLDGGKNNAGRDRDGVYQIGERRDIHI
jgi:hypothetical protein